MGGVDGEGMTACDGCGVSWPPWGDEAGVVLGSAVVTNPALYPAPRALGFFWLNE